MSEQAKKPGVLKQIVESFVKDFPIHHQQGEFSALFRELGKDLQQTWNEVAFGKPMHPSEIGTPLNPTPQIVTGELTGKSVMPDMHGVQSDPKQSTLDKIRGNTPVNEKQPEKQQERGGPEL